MSEETLREAVERQARARVDGDLATFASYVTSAALVALYRLSPEVAMSRTMRGYAIVEVTEDGGNGVSLVRYRRSGSHVIRSTWAIVEGHWKVIDASIPRDSVRPLWWQRVLGALGRAPQRATVERRDLQ